MNLITVKNLTKQMGGRLLFQDVDLVINEGDRIGLIGVNGSGKSTLLRILAGLEASDAGTVTVTRSSAPSPAGPIGSASRQPRIQARQAAASVIATARAAAPFLVPVMISFRSTM